MSRTGGRRTVVREVGETAESEVTAKPVRQLRRAVVFRWHPAEMNGPAEAFRALFAAVAHGSYWHKADIGSGRVGTTQRPIAKATSCLGISCSPQYRRSKYVSFWGRHRTGLLAGNVGADAVQRSQALSTLPMPQYFNSIL